MTPARARRVPGSDVVCQVVLENGNAQLFLSLVRLRLGLNSIFGRSAFVNKHEHAIRRGRAVRSAARASTTSRPTLWMSKLRQMEPVAVRVESDGEVETSFLTRSLRKELSLSPMQLAASVLSNSKYTLARGFYLMRRLFGDNVRTLYTDTDCYHLALAAGSLEKCERPLPLSVKRKLRRLLFGFPDARRAYSVTPSAEVVSDDPADVVNPNKPLSGTLKVEETEITRVRSVGGSG